MRSYNEIFRTIPVKKPRRNIFNLSHDAKLSCNMGELIPMLVEEVVPGDSFRINTEILCRFDPMIAPVMHRINVFTHFFFVPNRLIWNNWETFITGGEDGTESPVFPYVSANYVDTGSLADYLGISTFSGISPGIKFSALPFRAYQLIYNEYYRDQNLMDPIVIYKGDGVSTNDNSPGLFDIRKRSWEKDYFTSALPWAQRGGEVKLPFAKEAPIVFDDESGQTQIYRNLYGNPLVSESWIGIKSNSDASVVARDSAGQIQASNINLDVSSTHKVDLSDAAGVTVNDLRRTTRLQQWLERNARGGSRYIEQILSHFGVVGDDARLQRPQYLGGGKSPIVISEVLQTSATDSNSPQGNMSGHGIGAGSSRQFKHYFKEHGYIIGILSVLPRTGYQQGIPRHFFKFDKFDYYFPEFAHLGEQPIYNKELYIANDGQNDAVFGYTPRYAEYKHGTNRVHGDFRDTLSFWHLNRIFNSRPNLNANFIESDPSSRIFAVDDNGETQKVKFLLYHNIRAKRPMPKFGVPSL